MIVRDGIGVLALFLDGVLAGVFVGSSLVEHAARTLGARNWIAYKQAKEAVFGPVMPALFGIGLLVTIVAAALAPAPGVVVAAVLLGIVLAITVTVHLPLNRLFQSWSADRHPADWDEGRRRWRRWNVARSALAVAAFAILVLR